MKTKYCNRGKGNKESHNCKKTPSQLKFNIELLIKVEQRN